MLKDVRVIVKGVPKALPEDRIAYLVHSVMGHRSESVAVEELGERPDPPTGEEKTRAKMDAVKSKIAETKTKLGGSREA